MKERNKISYKFLKLLISYISLTVICYVTIAGRKSISFHALIIALQFCVKVFSSFYNHLLTNNF